MLNYNRKTIKLAFLAVLNVLGDNCWSYKISALNWAYYDMNLM